MFGKIFASTYTGSMFGAGPIVFAVWPYMLANANADSLVEVNPKLLGAILGCSPTDVEKALEYLQSPDQSSRSADEDGRRVVPEGPFLYRIVNLKTYQNIKSNEDLRRYNREAQRRSRARRVKPCQGACQDTEDMKTEDMKTGDPSVIPNGITRQLDQPGLPLDPPLDELDATRPDSPQPDEKIEIDRDPVPYELVIEQWNSICGDVLPKVTKLTAARKAAIRNRLEDVDGFDALVVVFQRVRASDFLTGKAKVRDGGTPFRTFFDWVMGPKNFVKVCEGNYDNRGRALPHKHSRDLRGYDDLIEDA